jgi:hypothetical protein
MRHGCAGASVPRLVTAEAAAQAPSDPVIQGGALAPAFSLAGSDGREYRRADDVGRMAVVVAWCPKAFATR